MKKFKVGDIPEDVKVVWVLTHYQKVFGRKMYDWIKGIIAKYPEYFKD